MIYKADLHPQHSLRWTVHPGRACATGKKARRGRLGHHHPIVCAVWTRPSGLAAVPALLTWFGRLQDGRDGRKYRIRDFTKGLEMLLDEVDGEAAGDPVGRPHFAKVMLRHSYVATRKEAFNRYLDTPEFQRIEKGTKPSEQTCVEKIKEAGGKVSLAHPYQIVLNGETLEELVKRLKGYQGNSICF